MEKLKKHQPPMSIKKQIENLRTIGLNIETYPTHIAGLPVAVNINCHATRHKEREL